MEQDLKSIGYGCAGIRTLILGSCIAALVLLAIEELNYDASLLIVVIFSILIVILLTVLVYSAIRALRGGPFLDIKKFCNKFDNPEAVMAQLAQVWDEDTFQNQNYRMNKDYLIFAKRLAADVILLKDVEFMNSKPTGTTEASKHRFSAYYRDGTVVQFYVSKDIAQHILENVMQNHPEIVIGERTTDSPAKYYIGKINARYRLILLKERYFIVDYSNPTSLASYPFFGVLLANKSSEAERYWHAWEISEEDLQSIKYKPYKESSISVATLGNIGLALGLLILSFAMPLLSAFPIHSLVGGHHWLLFLITISIFLMYFMYLKITSRLKIDNYAKFRISKPAAHIPQDEKIFTLRELLFYIVVRGFITLILLLVLMGFVFIWNVGLIVYLVCIYFMWLNIFFYFIASAPTIDSQSTIEKNDEPPTTFR